MKKQKAMRALVILICVMAQISPQIPVHARTQKLHRFNVIYPICQGALVNARNTKIPKLDHEKLTIPDCIYSDDAPEQEDLVISVTSELAAEGTYEAVCYGPCYEPSIAALAENPANGVASYTFRGAGGGYGLSVSGDVSAFLSQYGTEVATYGAAIANAINQEERLRKMAEWETSLQKVHRDYNAGFSVALGDLNTKLEAANSNSWAEFGQSLQNTPASRMILGQASDSSRADLAFAKNYLPFTTEINGPYQEHLLGQANEFANQKKYKDLADTIELLKYQKDKAQAQAAQAATGKWVNKSGILRPENIDPSLGRSPLGRTVLRSNANSPEGQIVRRLANKSQAAWATASSRGKLNPQQNLGFLLASKIVKDADKKIPDGLNRKELIAVARAVEKALLIAEGLVNGSIESLRSSLMGLGMVTAWSAELVWNTGVGLVDSRHADKAADMIINLVVNTPQYANAIYLGLLKDMDRFRNGSFIDRSEIIGALVTGVLTDRLGGKYFKAMGGSSAAGRAVGEVGDLVGDFGSYFDLERAAKVIAEEAAGLPPQTAKWLLEEAAIKPALAMKAVGVMRDLQHGIAGNAGLAAADLATDRKFVMGVVKAMDRLGVENVQGRESFARLLAASNDLPAPLEIARIREGTARDKFAVIGRTMGTPGGETPGVLQVQEVLRKKGVTVETFVPSEAANLEIAEMVKQNNDQLLPRETLKQTLLFRENMEWADALVTKGYTILDAGNPNNIDSISDFYEMELGRIFGEGK